ncbi:MAG: Peptidyl-tRNA hydrolase, partial [uncultured Blastococcus sp.]
VRRTLRRRRPGQPRPRLRGQPPQRGRHGARGAGLARRDQASPGEGRPLAGRLGGGAPRRTTSRAGPPTDLHERVRRPGARAAGLPPHRGRGPRGGARRARHPVLRGPPQAGRGRGRPQRTAVDLADRRHQGLPARAGGHRPSARAPGPGRLRAQGLLRDRAQGARPADRRSGGRRRGAGGAGTRGRAERGPRPHL